MYAYETFFNIFDKDVKDFSKISNHIEREIEWNIKLKKYKKENLEKLCFMDRIQNLLNKKIIKLTEYISTIKNITYNISKIQENKEIAEVWDDIKINLSKNKKIKNIYIFEKYEEMLISIKMQLDRVEEYQSYTKS
jgi:hypothetical protein